MRRPRRSIENQMRSGVRLELPGGECETTRRCAASGPVWSAGGSITITAIAGASSDAVMPADAGCSSSWPQRWTPLIENPALDSWAWQECVGAPLPCAAHVISHAVRAIGVAVTTAINRTAPRYRTIGGQYMPRDERAEGG